MKKHIEHELTGAIAQKIIPLLDHIGAHPFILQLSNGSLDQNIYNYYLLQDNFYLASYSKALENVANQTTFIDEKVFLTQCAIETTQEISAIKCKNKFISWRQSTKACFSYIQFLLRHTDNDYTRGLSAIFPCFFVYKEIAKKFYPAEKTNSYIDWFDTYSSELFLKQNKTIVKMINDEYGHSDKNAKKLMLEIIEQGCLLEWQFWDDAYHQKQFCPI